LKAESAKFWELFDRDALLQKVAGGFCFAEGPVRDPKGFCTPQGHSVYEKHGPSAVRDTEEGLGAAFNELCAYS
jgi:hypothetical protein